MLVLAATLAAVGGGYALAASGTQQAHGTLESKLMTDGCTSPVALCTAGRFTGVINGDFVFTATSFTPSNVPGIFFYDGTIVVRTSRGELRCADAGSVGLFDPTGPLVELCEITGGTGDWAGTTGTLRIHGTFTFADGGYDHYEGSITK